MTCVFRATRCSEGRSRGFTLIEVLMAAFVMAIGVLGLTALFAGAARQQQLASQTTRAVSASRSADAFIADRFGPIENIRGDAVLSIGDLPRNNQGNTGQIEPDQWYAIPRSNDGSLSLNPREATSGWTSTSLFTRSKPREILPKLMYRTRQVLVENQFIPTGNAGGDPLGQVGFGVLDDEATSAPAFDDAMRELRVLADSITVRVITRSFPCAGSTGRSLSTPQDETFLLRWDSSELTAPNFLLTDGSGNEMYVRIDATSKDSELLSSGNATRFTYAYIADVLNSVPESNCAGTELWAFTDVGRPCGDPELYVWEVAPGTGDVEQVASASTDPGYDIVRRTIDGQPKLVAELRPVDGCEPGVAMFRKHGGLGVGDYVLDSSSTVAPAGAIGTTPLAGVRRAQIRDRFIHEIWLEDYEYRGHTLASLPETVSYAEPASPSAPATPQLGYSMVFRRTSSSTVQYIMFAYAIAPTYSPSADKADTAEDDFFPRETRDDFAGNRAPLRLAADLRIEFDDDIGQYYLAMSAAQARSLAWVATPGQVLVFNGDADASPAIPGADGPVRVVSVRKLPGGDLRVYLDGPPRVGLRSLLDFDGGNEFDAWAVAPTCQVRRVKESTKDPVYLWGLRPVSARVFTITQ